MRWSEEQTVKFVKFYLQHEYLWNTNHQHYGQKYLRKEAYRNIASIFEDATGIHLEEREVMTKIKNLASTYAQELTKIKNKSKSNLSYKPAMKWFHYWYRCKQFNQPFSDDPPEIDKKIWIELSEPENNDKNCSVMPTDDDDEVLMSEVERSQQQDSDSAYSKVQSNTNSKRSSENATRKFTYEFDEHEEDMTSRQHRKDETHIKTKWNENDTMKFVKIYLQYEFLYDPKHKYFRDKKLRHEGYSNVISEFETATGIKLDEQELRAKIKILGSTYAQELSKIKKRIGTDQPYSPTIKWFQHWHRCKHLVQKRNAQNADDESQKPEDWDVSNDEDEKFESDSEESSHTQDSESEYEVKKKKMKIEKLSTVKSDIIFMSSITNSDCTKEDEFEHYGKYVASVLRSMDLDKALQVQLAIQNLLSEAQETNRTDTLCD